MTTPKLPNRWGRPGKDPRLKGMPGISWTLFDSFEYGWQGNIEPEPGADPVYILPPLEMAQALEQLARQIREFTIAETDGPSPRC